MSRPFVLWTRQRSASIAIFNALGAVSHLPFAESEPFDSSVEKRQFSDVPHSQRCRMLLDLICIRGWCLKHVYERLPLGFNFDLADATSEAGYAHIHLMRRDELARLVSLGVAENEVTWLPGEKTVDTFAQIERGERRARPLDVASLVARSREADGQWEMIRRRLPGWTTLVTEEVTAAAPGRRRPALETLLNVLEIPRSGLGEVERRIEGMCQNTRSVWPMVPNIDELRKALAQ